MMNSVVLDQIVRQQEEIESLRAELEAARLFHERENQAEEIESLRAELEQCKKDRLLLHSVVEERVKRTGDCWDQLAACQKDPDIWSQKAIELGLEASELGKQRDELLDAAIMAVEMIETNAHERRHVRFKLKDAIAKVGKETK